MVGYEIFIAVFEESIDTFVYFLVVCIRPICCIKDELYGILPLLKQSIIITVIFRYYLPLSSSFWKLRGCREQGTTKGPKRRHGAQVFDISIPKPLAILQISTQVEAG